MIAFAQYGILVILSATLIFHVLVLLRIVPYGIVWGGRLKSERDMYRFEVVSIVINFLFMAVILNHAGRIVLGLPGSVLTICLWVMTALFTLNTLGNLASKNKMERLIFTPITVVLALLCLLLALSDVLNK